MILLAISEMESLVFAILSPASSIRQRVRYSIGGTPTVSLNLSAKIDRDMPARCPNSSAVQSCAKFHNGQTLSMSILLGGLATFLAWWPSNNVVLPRYG
jgi:hypothetical protein